MTIDIICPLYNAERYILNLHKTLLEQEGVNLNKIRYVLTESKDKTERLLEDSGIEYKKIKKEEFSHSLTREKEAMSSNANILVFITQDIIIKQKDWLFNLVKDIKNGECVAAYSRQICENNSIEKYTRELNYPKESRVMDKRKIKEYQLRNFFFSDASSAIKTDIFKRINGYDNKDLPINEDMYIAYKIIMDGHKIKYCADSKVIHSHDFTLKEIYCRYKLTGKFFKENSYLDNYKVTDSGLSMAKYIFKRALQDKNLKVLFKFVPNMGARFIGMKIGRM